MNSFINSIQSVALFEVRFSSNKIYKNIIMYLKKYNRVIMNQFLFIKFWY